MGWVLKNGSLNQVIKNMLGFILRTVLLLAGLVFVASLLLGGLLLLAVWLLRAFWARLSGRPVQPWSFQINRQAMWSRFYRPPGRAPSPRHDQSDVIDAEVKEVKLPRS